MKNQAIDNYYALSVAYNQEKYWSGSTNKKKEARIEIQPRFKSNIL
ncbi:MAG: hypothetical protein ACRC2O_09645 [Chitinophagaceae bacterium]